MIDSKEVVIDNKVFIISKFPAVAGREIVANYPLTGLPKLGDYKANEAIMLKLMAYVAIPTEDPQRPLRLTSQALVDNHVGSWETLMKIERSMLEYNCSFFQNGRILNSLEDTAQIALAWLSKTWTALSERSSQMEKPR